jgi:hypothetical protein
MCWGTWTTPPISGVAPLPPSQESQEQASTATCLAPVTTCCSTPFRAGSTFYIHAHPVAVTHAIHLRRQLCLSSNSDLPFGVQASATCCRSCLQTRATTDSIAPLHTLAPRGRIDWATPTIRAPLSAADAAQEVHPEQKAIGRAVLLPVVGCSFLPCVDRAYRASLLLVGRASHMMAARRSCLPALRRSCLPAARLSYLAAAHRSCLSRVAPASLPRVAPACQPRVAAPRFFCLPAARRSLPHVTSAGRPRVAPAYMICVAPACLPRVAPACQLRVAPACLPRVFPGCLLLVAPVCLASLLPACRAPLLPACRASLLPA